MLPFKGVMQALAHQPELDEAPALTFDEVYARHAAFVFRALRRMGVSRADVPDAAQQLFLVVHRRLAEFQAGDMAAWLFGIALRVASDYRSRAHVRREVLTDAPPEQGGPAPQERAVEASQARELLDRLLGGLDEDKRAVFVLYEFEEWTMSKVAAAVGCPLQTAYSRHRAARQHLEQTAARELRPGDRV